MSVARFFELAEDIELGGPLVFPELELRQLDVPDRIDGISQLNEQLNAKLKERLGDGAEEYAFVSGKTIRRLTLLGDLSYKLIRLISKQPDVKRGELRIEGLTRLPFVVLPPLFRPKFLDYNVNLAYANPMVQEIFGFKEVSYPALVAGERLRLYFSEDVQPPVCINNGNDCQYLALGELALPNYMCEQLYKDCYEAPKDASDAIQRAKETGHLHPNYAFTPPDSSAKVAILKGNFKMDSRLLMYFAINGINMELKDEAVELLDGDMLTVLTSYVNGELEGLALPEPLRLAIRIRPNLSLPHERNEFMGILPEGPVKINFCERCNRETPFKVCEVCGSPTKPLNECTKCGIETVNERCPKCGGKTRPVVSKNYNIIELLSSAAGSLGLNVNTSEIIAAKSSVVFEPAQKAVLRKYFSVNCDSDGVHKIPVRVEASNVEPNKIIIPYRTASALAEVARFIDAELKLLYKASEHFLKYDPESLIGNRVVLMHRSLRYGVELEVAGLRNEFEALVNPNVISALFGGAIFNTGYVALGADMGLNYIGPKPFAVFTRTKPEGLPIQPYTGKSSFTRQGFVELEKGVLEGMAKLAPGTVGINEIIEHINEIELAYAKQKHFCEKCGKRYRVPPLNYKCTRCGSKLRPMYYTSELNIMIPILESLATRSGVEGDLAQLYLGKLQAMIKSSTQMSLFEF